MRKRIFFLIHNMNVGGVEKAMLGLFSAIPMDKYEVHLGMLHKKGGFLEDVPKQVIIHEISCYDKYWELINEPPLYCIKKMIKQWCICEALIHLLLYIHFRLTSNRYWFYRFIMRKEPVFPISYDLAVAFAGPSQMMDYYVCKHVIANVKCGWVHFDISKFGIDRGMTNQLYKLYNRIFIVSETGKEIFDKTFPQFSKKTEVFHNIVSPSQIRDMAKIGESYKDDFSGKRILTLGRISPEKGQVIAIRAFAILVKKVPNLRWYFIGHGIDLDNCKKEAKDLGVEDKVVFLGLKTNPYAYIRDCDIFVQPSRHEGYCISLREALCFRNPIVATDFTGAREQLKNRENGFVVGMDAESIAKGIEQALLSQKTHEVSDFEENDIHKLLDLIS